MKIYNGKALDSYCFDTIIVRDSKKRIDVKGKCNYPTIEIGVPFSKKIKGKEDTFQVNSLVDYYLNCSKIDVIADNFYMSHYREKFFVCQGNGRLFALQLPSIEEYRGIVKKVYNNFSINRNLFIEEAKKDKYRIVVSDDVGKYYNDGEYISMRLIGKSGKLIPSEGEFLVSFLNKKIEDGNGLMVPFIVNESDRFELNKRYNIYINDGTLISFLDGSALDVVQGALDNYNKEKELKKDVKVLKLEGF